MRKIEPDLQEFLIKPDPDNPRLTRAIVGVDHEKKQVDMRVVEERPLTIFLNSQEIVTTMTIGDQPEHLAIGYLLNQNMLRWDDTVVSVDYDDDLDVAVVRTERSTNYEAKLEKKTRTSGCAVGTVYGDMMEALDAVCLPKTELRISWLYTVSKKVNTQPSLYLTAGAIHGCALCMADKPILYVEDVGRHNAVDKIAGWMFQNGVSGAAAIFYTTGRLTSEMVIKSALMGIPILASRSGFTASGVEIAQQVGLTLIGRMRGQRFICLSGRDRLVWDADPNMVDDENEKHRRKGARDA